MAENMNEEIAALSPPKKNRPGQMVHRRERIMIVNLYKNLKAENPNITKREAHTILSQRTGFGIYSIKNTLLQYEKTGGVTSPNKSKHRVSKLQLVDEFDRNAIRRKIHQFYFNKELPTLQKVLRAINDDEDLPNFKRTSFWRLLKELNFVFVTRQRNSVLTERDDLIVWRRNYLRDLRKFRAEGRPIYYLDETWVNAGDVCSKEWVDTTVKSKKDAFLRGLSTGSPNPSGKGKRLIVLHIGSAAGFVPGGLLCFESKKNTADYHDEMNGDTFLEWFERILPLLEENAVIVMDNASYHSVKMEKLPNSFWKKADIIAWLQSKGKAADVTMLKAELLTMASLFKDNFNKYVVDEKAKEQNRRVLRLPPYHCELNPIEMVWSMVKGYVKSNNTTFKINDVKKLLEEGIERVTAENWTRFVEHVIHEENNLWVIDEIADRMMDEIPPVAFTVNTGSDSDTDWSD